MRRLVGCMGVLWLLAGCTVPSLEDLLKDKARECNAEHPCDEGYQCVQALCTNQCDRSVAMAGYRDEDGDGYAGTGAAYVIFCDNVPAGYASQGGDCDDNDKDSRPGASELCDGRDNNCDGELDQGLPKQAWYPDRDGDGFGDQKADALMACARPTDPSNTRYVQDATDCGDSDPEVFPRPGINEALCDGVDNDCDGNKDDGFAIGIHCSNPCSGGKLACNASQNGVSCIDSPPTISYYPDLDGDGAGDERGTPAQVCPSETPPPGFVLNTDDCDDWDKYNRRNKAEVCDDRDNNCDTRRDEEDICGGKGWKVANDPALTGNKQWKTVGLGANGRVWIAGDGGKIAVRLAAGEAFRSLDGSCGNFNWRAAWVSPNNNHVYLAGSGGNLAEHDGGNCYNQVTVPSGNTLQGLIGISPLIYVVDDRGRLYVWSPGVSLSERYNLNPVMYFDIHGLDSTKLLTIGGTEDSPSTPYITSYPGTGSTATYHSVSTPSGYNGALRGVWMASSNLAYAVGDSGLVVKWDGATSWTRMTPPSDSSSAPFTSVVAPDPFTIYVTDANPSGAIRRLSATGAWSTAYTLDKPLRDIAVTSQGDIWAVGDDGRVVHFPE
ncbi:putative metal-binding motif-containing protein [Archangium lipolyticum]|uniref:putative metal-binding motif-containing protein n=1 Tax=Archangium lipolyticum TaxID=2970465 RepID=UPI00214A4A54|nr:putative metal-binding motif-containing protein [Archangium lipolyticum]